MSPKQMYNLLAEAPIAREPSELEAVRLIIGLGADPHWADVIWRVLLLQTTPEEALACAARNGIRTEPEPEPAAQHCGRTLF